MMETASWPSCTIAAVCLSGLLTLLSPVVWAVSNVEDEGQGNKVLQEKVKGSQAVRLSVEGISASAGEDEPRVLTILPWRAPTLPRQPRTELDSTAAELVQPVDPLVLERHREFRQSLGITPPGGRPGERR